MRGVHAHPTSEDPLTGPRVWLLLAVSSLVIAGALALMLVIGRLPGLSALFDDPAIFRRGLVVHVCLSLVAWLSCGLVGLHLLLPARRPSWGALPGAAVSATGMLAMVLGAGVRDAVPVLANYVPVIDTPLYHAGLTLLFAGAALALAGPRLLPGTEVEGGLIAAEARPWLRAAGLLPWAALLTWGASELTTIPGLTAETRAELLAWGGGHVLQAAASAAMVGVWLMLLRSALGRAALSRPLSALLAGLFALPWLAAPLFTARGTSADLYRDGLTRLMEWGIFPTVTLVAGLGLRAVARARREGRLPPRGLADPRLMGLGVSLGLTALGYLLGALIRGSNTIVPAHYHAAIGGVTAAYMAAIWYLLEPLGMPLLTARARRLAGWQPLVYGGGQALFALGFALAGAAGMERKTYGAEQHIRTLQEWLGLGLMGLGGLIAVAGGLIFLGLVLGAAYQRLVLSARHLPQPTGGSSDQLS